jgi:hypothetical protein
LNRLYCLNNNKKISLLLQLVKINLHWLRPWIDYTVNNKNISLLLQLEYQLHCVRPWRYYTVNKIYYYSWTSNKHCSKILKETLLNSVSNDLLPF